MSAPILSNAFKRVAVGQMFTHAGVAYRKSGTRTAYRLKADGRGETHAPVKFARSTKVTPSAIAA